MADPLIIKIPFLPPSSNHVYKTIWALKRRALSKEADQFIKQLQGEVIPLYINDLQNFKLDDRILLSVFIEFKFSTDSILSKTYGLKNGAQSRYKKIDLDNRVKLLLDCLTDCLGIDDSRIFNLQLTKRKAKDTTDVGITVIFNKVDPTDFGI